MTKAPPLTMLTFAPTIDSECTRLVLGFHQAPFTERDRLFGWVSLLTLFHGGYGRLPLVYGRGVHLSGSGATARYLDTLVGPDKRLVPRDQPLKEQVEADFALYNNELGFDVATFAYFHLLPERAKMIESLGGPITPLGRAALPSVYGPLHWLFKVLLRLRPERIADVGLRIEALLDWTDQRVSDGRRCLHADRATLADIGLMSAMAPILLPPHYAKKVPPLDELPAPFRKFVTDTRKRPSGLFVLRLYTELTAGPVGAPRKQRVRRNR